MSIYDKIFFTVTITLGFYAISKEIKTLIKLKRELRADKHKRELFKSKFKLNDDTDLSVAQLLDQAADDLRRGL